MNPWRRSASAVLRPASPAPTMATVLCGPTLPGIQIAGVDAHPQADRAAASWPASVPKTRAGPSVDPLPGQPSPRKEAIAFPAAHSPGTGAPSGRSTRPQPSVAGPPLVPDNPA